MRNKTTQEKERDFQNIRHDLNDTKNIILVNNTNLKRKDLIKLSEIINDKEKYNVIKHQELTSFLNRFNLYYEIVNNDLKIYQK